MSTYLVVANLTVQAENPGEAAAKVRQMLVESPRQANALDWKVPVKMVEEQ